MVLKIERAPDERETVFLLSGRIESAGVQQLKAQIDGNTGNVVLDLQQVQIVDLDAVHFLAVCEAEGVSLRHCPQFVRAWILAEGRRMAVDEGT